MLATKLSGASSSRLCKANLVLIGHHLSHSRTAFTSRSRFTKKKTLTIPRGKMSPFNTIISGSKTRSSWSDDVLIFCSHFSFVLESTLQQCYSHTWLNWQKDKQKKQQTLAENHLQFCQYHHAVDSGDTQMVSPQLVYCSGKASLRFWRIATCVCSGCISSSRLFCIVVPRYLAARLTSAQHGSDRHAPFFTSPGVMVRRTLNCAVWLVFQETYETKRNLRGAVPQPCSLFYKIVCVCVCLVC